MFLIMHTVFDWRYQPDTHVYIGVVSRHDPQWLVVVGRPEARRPVVAARGEIVAVRRKPHIPHREYVALVADQTGPRLQGPQPDCRTRSVGLVLRY